MNNETSDLNMTGSWVYVVEDDPSVRDSLSMLLQLRGFSTAVFDSAESFLEADAFERPACVLADVRLPGMSGLELQRKLADHHSALPFVVMTAHGDVATARSALRDGAVDFLEKPIDEQDLIDAITVALKSDHEQVERARNRENVLARMQRLTERELEVFERVTGGYHNREIAEEFGISQRTVEVHRARLMEKLTQAVTNYLQLQIDAGAEAVQVFDSLGGVLSDGDFARASGCWIKQIVAGLNGQVPVIVFAKGAHGNWDDLVNTGAQVLGVDWNVRLAEVRARLPETVGVQGNLDPFLLCTTPEAVAAETGRILREMRGRPGHIFNLGHGVPPGAKLENIESLVRAVRSFEWRES